MKVKELIQTLSEYPGEASVELGRLIAIKTEDGKDSAYDVILDFPIIGIAYHDQDNDVRLLVQEDHSLELFGKVTPFVDSIETDTSPLKE